jgi:hypothetical protein
MSETEVYKHLIDRWEAKKRERERERKIEWEKERDWQRRNSMLCSISRMIRMI